MIHWLQCWFVVTVPWQPALLSGPSASGPWCRQGKNLTEESKWWSERVTGWWHLFSLLLLQQCAVEFEIQAFSAESQDAKIRKRWVSAWSLRCSPSTTFTFKQTQNCSWVEENKSFEISVLYLIICSVQEHGEADAQEGPVRSRRRGSGALCWNHQGLRHVGQTASCQGQSGQRGEMLHKHSKHNMILTFSSSAHKNIQQL